MNEVWRRALQEPTLRRVNAKAPAQKSPMTTKSSGLHLHGVDRPPSSIVAIGGFVCALFVHLFMLSRCVLLIGFGVGIPLEPGSVRI
jgi:hypothetical protein